MKPIWDHDAYTEVVERIRRISAERPTRWGKMNPPQILAHMADQIRMGLGDIPSRRPSGVLSFWPMNYLAIHVVPWPHGAKGPQEAFTTRATTWESDRQQLLDLIDRMRAKRDQSEWPEHSLFGKLSGHDWAALTYKHLTHHLKQLGV